MQDRPTAGELLEAVRIFLETEVLPDRSAQRERFRTLVAINVVTIVERELNAGSITLREEAQGLARLLGRELSPPESDAKLVVVVRDLNAELAWRIRCGELPDGTLQQLLSTTVGKLAITSPGYLARSAESV